MRQRFVCVWCCFLHFLDKQVPSMYSACLQIYPAAHINAVWEMLAWKNDTSRFLSKSGQILCVIPGQVSVLLCSHLQGQEAGLIWRLKQRERELQCSLIWTATSTWGNGTKCWSCLHTGKPVKVMNSEGIQGYKQLSKSFPLKHSKCNHVLNISDTKCMNVVKTGTVTLLL